MSKDKRDEPVVILENTSGKHIQWDVNRPGIDRVAFMPGGSVAMTAEQMAHRGKLPPGVVERPYDERKHGKKNKIGG